MSENISNPSSFSSSKPSRLLQNKYCNKDLKFKLFQSWPSSLPGVSVNGVILAGFDQEWIFDHSVDWVKNPDELAQLFRSLYFDLAFVEAASLVEKIQNWNLKAELIKADSAMPESSNAGPIKTESSNSNTANFTNNNFNINLAAIPVAEILKKFGWQYNLNFQKTALQILATPDCFQKWCYEKKMNLMDLASLLSVTKEQLTQSKYLNQFFQDISSFNFSKSIGSQVLELGIELFLIEDSIDFQNKSESESKTELKSDSNKLDFQQLSQAKSAEAYLEILKKARFPMTYKQDLSIEKKWQNISWPSQAQVRFTRYGDKAGVEMRLFVSQATDLKKYLISLEKAYQMLENENLIKTEH